MCVRRGGANRWLWLVRYNSSVLCWDAEDDRLRDCVYRQLVDHHAAVTSAVHRFDHWLEMTVQNACRLQVGVLWVCGNRTSSNIYVVPRHCSQDS